MPDLLAVVMHDLAFIKQSNTVNDGTIVRCYIFSLLQKFTFFYWLKKLLGAKDCHLQELSLPGEFLMRNYKGDFDLPRLKELTIMFSRADDVLLPPVFKRMAVFQYLDFKIISITAFRVLLRLFRNLTDYVCHALISL